MIWLLITFAGFLAAYLFSWWTIPIVAMVFCYFLGNSWGAGILQAFLAGVAVNAGLMALSIYRYGIDIFDPLAHVLMLPTGWTMAIASVVLGGLLAAIGGAAGYSLRTLSTQSTK